MSIYRPKGSKVFVMDFMFHSQRIRETTGMTSKTRAKEVYDKRKQSLKDGTAGIRRQARPDLLSTAAAEWQQAKQLKWSPKMASIVRYSIGHLLPVLGKKLLVDIEARDVAKYQTVRRAEGASNRTVNIEVGMLRQIMRKYGAWARIQADVTMLPERQDVGCALTPEQETMLLLECGRSVSRALLPFVTLALETGARYNTIRTTPMGQHRLCRPLPQVRQRQDGLGHGPDDPAESAGHRNLEVLGTAISQPATGAFRLSIGAIRTPRNRRDFRRDCPGLRL